MSESLANPYGPQGFPLASPYLQRILRARVYDVAIESPLDPAPNLSRRLGNQVLLKREDLQPVFSFKLRGAYNRMAGLSAEELERGVIAASAGNHAQGVALSAQRLGCRAVIVMPVTTPEMKVRSVAARGAEVVLHGDTYDEACSEARRLEQERNLTFIHPFDDPEQHAEGRRHLVRLDTRQRRGRDTGQPACLIQRQVPRLAQCAQPLADIVGG